MTDHVETALDLLRNADDLVLTREQQFQAFIAGAQVHALLELAQTVREAGMQAAVPPIWVGP